MEYSYFYEVHHVLGIRLYSGRLNHNRVKEAWLTDENYADTLHARWLRTNLNANNRFFQSADVVTHLYRHLHLDPVSSGAVKQANPYRARYRANVDVFVHLRLGDASGSALGAEYYVAALLAALKNNNKYGGGDPGSGGAASPTARVFVSTDEPAHPATATLLQRLDSTIRGATGVNNESSTATSTTE